MSKKESDLIFKYTKLRRNFGKQTLFCETPVVFLDTINASIRDQNQYCLRNPVNRETQTSISTSEHDVNTKTIVHHVQGINHSEGGWPKDISGFDEEATSRYKRRIERDEGYVDAVLSLYPEFIHYIDQNNGIEMYNMYFKGMPTKEPVEKSSIRIKSVFKDTVNRPISSIDWTYEEEPKLVVAYCNKKCLISESVHENNSCFVWNVELPNMPTTDLLPPSPCCQVACSPIEPSVIIGGLNDGRVCIFDIRARKEPMALCANYLAHRDHVTALLYLHSRLNNEFFSGSTDGRCLWWDIRNISEPIDALIMSIRIPLGEQMSLANAEGVSALQFDKSFPTKFLCGTDTGFVINVNRKGKTYAEVISATFNAHSGIVKSVHRHPSMSKFFITCGDWRVNIWCDDVQTAPIISGIVHKYQLSDVVWAPQRVSGYMSVGEDGKLRYWDLLRRSREPIAVLPVSKNALLKIRPHDEGKLIAIGDSKGVLYLLSLSENLVIPGNKDKQLMIQTFERETRREHILATRVKEILLKKKMENEERVCEINEDNYEYVIKNSEEEYKKIVNDEMRNAGISPLAASRTQTKRKR